jgi:cytochrome c-type biogenesis protein CcmH/NrfG
MWLGNYDNAVGYFENAVNRNPKRAEAWMQVGYCKVKQGKSQEAIRAYQQALQLEPDSPEIRNKLGDAYYYAGRLREQLNLTQMLLDLTLSALKRTTTWLSPILKVGTRQWQRLKHESFSD